MTIRVGEALPNVNLQIMENGSVVTKTTQDLFGKRRVILFGLPGAFTPVCSAKHVPGFVDQAPALKAKGIDALLVISVNDAYTMHAWEKEMKATGVIEFIADGNGDFTKAVGLVFDGVPFGMGLRSQRYAMVIKDGIIEALNIEPSTATCGVSSAEHMLETVTADKVLS
jgi:peroxiredoxin